MCSKGLAFVDGADAPDSMADEMELEPDGRFDLYAGVHINANARSRDTRQYGAAVKRWQ